MTNTTNNPDDKFCQPCNNQHSMKQGATKSGAMCKDNPEPENIVPVLTPYVDEQGLSRIINQKNRDAEKKAIKTLLRISLEIDKAGV